MEGPGDISEITDASGGYIPMINSGHMGEITGRSGGNTTPIATSSGENNSTPIEKSGRTSF
jgi:hypothetical protein